MMRGYKQVTNLGVGETQTPGERMKIYQKDLDVKLSKMNRYLDAEMTTLSNTMDKMLEENMVSVKN